MEPADYKIIDEVPDNILDQISEDEFVMYLVIMKRRAHVHEATPFGVMHLTLNKSEFDKEKIKRGCDQDKTMLLGMFIDKNKAELFFRFAICCASARYTAFIRELDDLSSVRDRNLLVYIGHETTNLPGVYQTKKEDYDKLLSSYQDVRFPTNAEMKEALKRKIASSFIPRDYEFIKFLELPNLRAIKPILKMPLKKYQVICEIYDAMHNMWGEIKANCIRLVKEDSLINKELIMETMKEMEPDADKAEEIVDRMIQLYRDIKDGKDMTGEGMYTPKVRLDKILDHEDLPFIPDLPSPTYLESC